jgi:hypothetical protein
VTAAAARARFRSVAIALVIACLCAGGTQAQRSALQNPNLDIRTERDAAAAAYLARFMTGPATAAMANVSSSRANGLARLRSAVGEVDVIDSPELGTPEIIGTKPGVGFLTPPSADRVATFRTFLATYADAYGLTPNQVAGLELVADYENPAGNMAWVEFEQRINGLPVFRGLIRGGFTARGELARSTGQLASYSDGGSFAVTPSYGAAEAVSRAAASVGWFAPANALAQTGVDRGKVTIARGPMADDASAWLMYFPLAPGVARLAWCTEIWGDPDAYMVVLDADTSTVLFRKNLTNFQTQAATYRVYTEDSPAPMSPSTTLPGSGTQAPFISRTSVTLIGNEPPTTFNNLGWMTDGVNGGNGFTDGNNVEAGLDRDGVNGVDAPIDGASRVFDFAFNPAVDEPLAGSPPINNYQRGEATDAFYWTNLYHDRLYLLGFTEVARNFQNDNFGRGGAQADRIRAELQDSSGTNNANFSTLSDGNRGRMQMFIFPGPTPDRSSGLDHDILLHELTHGTSNRLHNNASGLQTTFAASMGEGWSDFYARALLSTAAEDPNGIYAAAAWSTFQLLGLTDNYYYGIRRFPYAVKTNVGANGKPHNPLTFADVDATQINTSDGAFARNPIFGNTAFEVHNAGEIWCMALLEVRARFINRLGFAVGNQRILQIVTDAMKLDPVNPHFLQGRDSILAAANAGGATVADIADIWNGFATRGMGVSAQVLNAGTGSVIEAFDTPGLVATKGVLITESIPNGRLDPTETVTVSLCVGNQSGATTGGVTGTLLPGGGVVSVSGPEGYGNIPVGGNVCRTFTFTVNAACGATLTATLQTVENGGGTKSLKYTFIVGSVSTFFSERFDLTALPVLPPGWTTSTLAGTANLWITNTGRSDTSPNNAFAGDPSTTSDSVLVSPTVAVPAAASQLMFRHSFSLENTFDGGVLEISIGGGAFQDILTAGGSFVAGGYSASLQGGTPLGNRQAWTGSSGGYITTTVNLPAGAQGQNIMLRWRVDSDVSVSGAGWSVDTISAFIAGVQCGAGVSFGTDLIQNGNFNGGTAKWQTFSSPDASFMESNGSDGMFQLRRIEGPPGQAPSQGVLFQETGLALGTGTPLLAQFDLGNTSSSRKYMKVLIVGDPNFNDLAACTFQLGPNAPMRTYRMLAHTTQPSTNTAIYFYASSAKDDEGFYQVDNVSLQVDSSQPADRVLCVDPLAPGSPGGPDSSNLLTNGDFGTGLLSPWTLFGTITDRNPIVGGVFEFIRPDNTFPRGAVLQATSQAMTLNQIMTVTLQLGNSSGVRKRVLLLGHDRDFSDLAACTWWLEPAQALSNFTMTFYASKAWTNATVSVYAWTIGLEEWSQLDNVTLQRTPGTSTVGTECIELGPAPLSSATATRSAANNDVPTSAAVVSTFTAPTAPLAAPDQASGSGWAPAVGGWEATATESGVAIHALDDPIDLTSASAAQLSFASRLSSAGGSQAAVQVSVDDGRTWTTIETMPPTDDWTHVVVDLDAFLGEMVGVRFVFDEVAPASGFAPDTWSIDQWEVVVTPRHNVRR